jgi:hypothetical protein
MALWTSIVFAVTAFMLTWAHGLALQNAEWVAMTPFAGVIFGTCLAASRTARMVIGFGCVPLALLAIAEIAGLHNPWPSLVHATTFVTLDNIPGSSRAQSTFGHPLIAGGCLAGLSVIMLQARTKYCLPVAATLAGGALATVSRSAILGLGAAIVCSFIVSNQRVRRLAEAVVIAGFVVLIVSQIPTLSDSITNRLTNGGSLTITYSDQPVRAYAVTKVTFGLAHDPGTLLLGGGVGASTHALSGMGGIDGYDIFDNQYVTSIYDVGLLPMILVGVLLACALASASREARVLGLPALVAIAGVMFFTDGGYWLSLGFLAWVTVGLATAPVADV